MTQAEEPSGDPFVADRLGALSRQLDAVRRESDARAAAAEVRVAELAKELEVERALRRRTIDEIRRTETWRAGVAVTAPVRAVRRRLLRSSPVTDPDLLVRAAAPLAWAPVVVRREPVAGDGTPLPLADDVLLAALPVLGTLAGRRVAVIACYDERRVVGLNVQQMATAYRNNGWAVVVVYSAPLRQDLIDAEPDQWRRTFDGIYSTQHSRRDFHSWQLALRAVPGLAEASELILTNDSVIGPLFDVGPLLREMARRGDDVVGAVESAVPEAHLQSWLVYFGPRVMRSGDLVRFLSIERAGLDKRSGIELLEIPLAGHFLRLGYRVSAVLGALQLDAGPENSSVARWDRILDLGIPFVKRELFTNPVWMQRVDAETILVKCRAVGDVDPMPLVADALDSIAPDRNRPGAGRQTEMPSGG